MFLNEFGYDYHNKVPFSHYRAMEHLLFSAI